MSERFSERLSTDQIFARRKTLQEAVCALAQEVLKLPRAAAEAPAPHALLYGGGVRDLLLGERLRDADIQVYGVAPAVLERMLHSLFPGSVERAGKEYEILKVTLSRSDELDVSIARTKTGGVSRFDEGDPLLFPLIASRYRDFTINSMSLDPLTGIVYDPFDGRSDLHTRRLRLVDEETFSLRGVHVLRGCQFVARFGLSIDERTAQVMAALSRSEVVDRIPLNAVREELRKLLLVGKKPSTGMMLLHRFELLSRYFPARVAGQKKGDMNGWMAKLDRGIQLGRMARLYPEHILIAQLALLLSPLRQMAEGPRIEAVHHCLSALCFSGFQRAAVAEILSGFNEAVSVLGDAPQRRVGSARPHRSTRRGGIGEEGQVRNLSAPVFAPRPAVALALAVFFGRSLDEMNALCEPREGDVSEATHGNPHLLVPERDVDALLGGRASPEVRERILAELVAHRYELVTRARACDYVRAMANQ